MIAFKKLPEFEFRSALGTWLTQIAINLCYNRYRTSARMVVREEGNLESLLRGQIDGRGSPKIPG